MGLITAETGAVVAQSLRFVLFLLVPEPWVIEEGWGSRDRCRCGLCGTDARKSKYSDDCVGNRKSSGEKI